MRHADWRHLLVRHNCVFIAFKMNLPLLPQVFKCSRENPYSRPITVDISIQVSTREWTPCEEHPADLFFKLCDLLDEAKAARVCRCCGRPIVKKTEAR
jgi:hypothetical protein